MPSLSNSPPPKNHRFLAWCLGLTKFAGQHRVPIVEGLLAWTTVVVFGIRYVVEYARLRWKLYRLARAVASSSSPGTAAAAKLSASLPLCPLAHTAAEAAVGTGERWERLRWALVRASLNGNDEPPTPPGANHSSSSIEEWTREWTDERWIEVVRSSLEVRRQASHLMLELSERDPSREDGSNSNSKNAAAVVRSKLERLWPRFLQFPDAVVRGIGGDASAAAASSFSPSGEGTPEDSIHSDSGSGTSQSKHPSFAISLIVPMYRERVGDIGDTLARARDGCRGNPQDIQVVVVRVEHSPPGTDNDDNDGGDSETLRRRLASWESPNQPWGELTVVTIPFGEARGRGKTLNAGASRAVAPLLTFLHADTRVPPGWDAQIRGALQPPITDDDGRFFPHACAFTMAIEGVGGGESSSWLTTTATPGLIGAEWLGVLRCHCGLPYGDSVLSFSRPVFDYMGGYPEQPLMEDYEVMDWLRLRSLLLTTLHNQHHTQGKSNRHVGRSIVATRGEGLVLLADRARCSPRRWQKYGVAYTSLVNAVCIFRYRSRTSTAEELFDFYYHCNRSTTTASIKPS